MLDKKTDRQAICDTWRPIPIGSLDMQVIFRKRATNYWALLRKMSYEEQASYGSSPPCMRKTMQKAQCISKKKSIVKKREDRICRMYKRHHTYSNKNLCFCVVERRSWGCTFSLKNKKGVWISPTEGPDGLDVSIATL